MTIIEDIRRRGERQIHKAALAIQRGDFEAKRKHLEEAEVCRRLLLEAGEPGLNPSLNADEAPERCLETEDLFS